MSKITVALMRNLEHQVNQGEISYSRMVEILNETVQPPTQQPAKSLEVQLCPKCHGQGVTSRPPGIPADVQSWSSSVSTHLCDVCEGAKVLFLNQPHPQDIGRVEGGSLPCDICGDSICQCSNTPPASESLEQAAENFLTITKNWSKVTYTRTKIKQMLIDFAQSTQQQKPMAMVLTDENDFIKWFSKMKYDRKTFDFAKAIWNEINNELRNRMSAANGVDLFHFLNWVNDNCETAAMDTIYFSDEYGEASAFTVRQVIQTYLTEQSQKG